MESLVPDLVLLQSRYFIWIFFQRRKSPQLDTSVSSAKLDRGQSRPVSQVVLSLFLCYFSTSHLKSVFIHTFFLPINLLKYFLETLLGDFPGVQWLRLCSPSAGGLGLIPGQGTRSHMLQVKDSACHYHNTKTLPRNTSKGPSPFLRQIEPCLRRVSWRHYLQRTHRNQGGMISIHS